VNRQLSPWQQETYRRNEGERGVKAMGAGSETKRRKFSTLSISEATTETVSRILPIW